MKMDSGRNIGVDLCVYSFYCNCSYRMVLFTEDNGKEDEHC